MTAFVYQLSVATPTALITQANHLAAYLGGSEPDLNTFSVARYTKDDVDYCFIATVVTATALQRVAQPTELPPFVEGAVLQQALQALSLTDAAQAAVLPPAQPDRITAIIGLDCDAALAALGLTLKAEQVGVEDAKV